MKPNSDLHRAADALRLATSVQPGDLEHPSYAELEAFVDLRLDAADREVIESHLEVCEMCAEDVADLNGVRAELQAPAPVQAKRGSSPRPWQIAAAVLAVVAIGAALRLWLANDGSADRKGPALQSDVARNSDGARKSGGAADPQVPETAMTPDERALVDRVVAAGVLEVPSGTRALAGPVGTLLGPGPTSARLSPITPIGTAVLSATPEFTWRPLAGASSYTIAIYDERFSEVAKSPLLTSTSWTPAAPLPRGTSLAWQVTAHTSAGDVLAPAPPQPEARFVIVSEATAAAIEAQRARLANEPLALGVVLAHAGLFADAEQALTRAASSATADAARAKLLLSSLKK